jgi:hypothetical protein
MRERQRFRALCDELENNPAIQVKRCEITFHASKGQREKALAAGAPPPLVAFYEGSNGFDLNWTGVDAPTRELSGRARLLPLSEALQNWRGVVYFDDTPKDDSLHSFRPFDFFTDEAHVGLYWRKDQDNSVYLHDFGTKPLRLDLDVAGYVELLLLARGFLYWQHAVLTLKTGVRNASADEFRKQMPKLFSGFAFEDFASAYERLRLSKRPSEADGSGAGHS